VCQPSGAFHVLCEYNRHKKRLAFKERGVLQRGGYQARKRAACEELLRLEMSLSRKSTCDRPIV